MLANECLSHPWLDKEVIPTPKANADDKIINTKNLRRFVIRRRWQVYLILMMVVGIKLF
jgi:hypothetical protein